MAVLTTIKGLPLAYNRDMQLDKEPLFSSVETVIGELKIMVKFIKGIKLKVDNISTALQDQTLYATELADFLVTKKKLSFRKAHEVVGKIIRHAEDKGVRISDIPEKTLKRFCKELFPKDVARVMNPHYAVSSRKSSSHKIPEIKFI